MTTLKAIYKLLELMVRHTKKKDCKTVFEINELFERLLKQIFPDLLNPLKMEYDNCRQSCIKSCTIPSQSEMYIADALQKFHKIPKP